MNKVAKIFMSSLAFMLLIIPSVYAVCPVCTIAVGAGLEGARLLGVDDVITGIWAGGLTLSIFFWTAGWLKKRGVTKFFWYAFVPFVIYYAFLGAVYLLPDINFGQNIMWGMDKLMLGIILGTITFYIGARLHNVIKARNAGRSYIPFQKVIVPFILLLILTGIFSAIIYL